MNFIKGYTKLTDVTSGCCIYITYYNANCYDIKAPYSCKRLQDFVQAFTKLRDRRISTGSTHGASACVPACLAGGLLELFVT